MLNQESYIFKNFIICVPVCLFTGGKERTSEYISYTRYSYKHIFCFMHTNTCLASCQKDISIDAYVNGTIWLWDSPPRLPVEHKTFVPRHKPRSHTINLLQPQIQMDMAGGGMAECERVHELKNQNSHLTLYKNQKRIRLSCGRPKKKKTSMTV